MKNNIYCQKLPDRMMQKCPLCGENHPMMMKGLSQDIENRSLQMANDRGYSFCNCRNIFYTDWKNIKMETYDEDYFKKYDFSDTKKIATFEAKKFYEVIKHYNKDVNTIFEIGAVQDYVLDVCKERGMITAGIDLVNKTSKHNVIHGNFEDFKTDLKFDVIWASHVFEHFKDPTAQLKKCLSMLTPGGLLYVAMPDTFFIDFDNEKQIDWDWVIQEHHILWNMNDFASFAEDLGFKCIYKERSTDLHEQVDKTWFWKRDFKVLLRND